MTIGRVLDTFARRYRIPGGPTALKKLQDVVAAQGGTVSPFATALIPQLGEGGDVAPFTAPATATVTFQPTGLVDFDVRLPQDAVAGDLLIMAVASTDAMAPPANWDIETEGSSGADLFLDVYSHVLEAPAPATATVTGSPVQGQAVVFCFKQWGDPAQEPYEFAAAPSTGDSTTPDAPNVNAPWGVKRNAFLELAAVQAGTLPGTVEFGAAFGGRVYGQHSVDPEATANPQLLWQWHLAAQDLGEGGAWELPAATPWVTTHAVFEPVEE